MDSIQSITFTPCYKACHSTYIFIQTLLCYLYQCASYQFFSFQSIYLYIFRHFAVGFQMDRDETSSSSFPMGETAQEKGFSHVPQCYTLPTSNRPSLNPETVYVHVVDWAGLNNPDQRSHTINQIKIACSRSGCFQVSLLN